MIYIDIKTIIEQISYVLQYFVPGFIGLSIFLFFTTKTVKNQTFIIPISVVWSYLLNSILGINLNSFNLKMVLLSIGIAGLSGWIFALLFLSRSLNLFTLHMGSKSINSDIFRDIFDYDVGCTLHLFDKDENHVYVGHLFEREENGDESWIALSNCLIYKITDSDNWVEIPQSDEYVKIFTIRLSDIKCINIFYDENSEIIQREDLG